MCNRPPYTNMLVRCLQHVSGDWTGNGTPQTYLLSLTLMIVVLLFFFFKQHLHKTPLVTIMLCLYETINVTRCDCCCFCSRLTHVTSPQQINAQSVSCTENRLRQNKGGLSVSLEKPVKAGNITQLNHSRQWELLIIIFLQWALHVQGIYGSKTPTQMIKRAFQGYDTAVQLYL